MTGNPRLSLGSRSLASGLARCSCATGSPSTRIPRAFSRVTPTAFWRSLSASALSRGRCPVDDKQIEIARRVVAAGLLADVAPWVPAWDPGSGWSLMPGPEERVRHAATGAAAVCVTVDWLPDVTDHATCALILAEIATQHAPEGVVLGQRDGGRYVVGAETCRESWDAVALALVWVQQR